MTRRSLLLAAVLLATSIQASTVRPLNLEQLTARAATIFSGHCISVRTIPDAETGTAVTEVTFRVDRTAKGAHRAERPIRIVEQSGRTLPFREGDEVVLFLYGENDRGLAATVGLAQGRFTVVTDKRGGKVAIGAFEIDTLWRDLTPEAESRMRASGLARSHGRTIELARLLDAVSRLSR